jgi:hypothetical protein
VPATSSAQSLEHGILRRSSTATAAKHVWSVRRAASHVGTVMLRPGSRRSDGRTASVYLRTPHRKHGLGDAGRNASISLSRPGRRIARPVRGARFLAQSGEPEALLEWRRQTSCRTARCRRRRASATGLASPTITVGRRCQAAAVRRSRRAGPRHASGSRGLRQLSRERKARRAPPVPSRSMTPRRPGPLPPAPHRRRSRTARGIRGGS